MSVEFTGALVKEQGIEFMIILVKKNIIDNHFQRQNAVNEYQRLFGIPSIIAAQDSRGDFKYFGREDISRFLSSIHPSRISWSTFRFG